MFVGKISSSSHRYSLLALLWTERIEVRVVAIRPSSFPRGGRGKNLSCIGEGRVRSSREPC